jgi:hypothetical protein
LPSGSCSSKRYAPLSSSVLPAGQVATFPTLGMPPATAPSDALSVQNHCSAIMPHRLASGGSIPGTQSCRVKWHHRDTLMKRSRHEMPRFPLQSIANTRSILPNCLPASAPSSKNSTECENRNSKGAALHACLCTAAVCARHMIELALLRIIGGDADFDPAAFSPHGGFNPGFIILIQEGDIDRDLDGIRDGCRLVDFRRGIQTNDPGRTVRKPVHAGPGRQRLREIPAPHANLQFPDCLNYLYHQQRYG